MNISMKLLVITFVTIFGVFIIGYSRKMQKHFIKRFAKDDLAKYNPVYWWVISPLYIPSTQVTGAVTIGIAIFLIFHLK